MRSNHACILSALVFATALCASLEAQPPDNVTTDRATLERALDHANKIMQATQGTRPPASLQSEAAPGQEATPTACTLITAAEMTAILGGAVTAEADDRLGQTECIYSSTQDFGPYAELQLSWGDGEAGMAGAGMAGSQLGPGIVNPYAGLGDQATSVGPMLLIKRGEDLIEIVLSGVDDTSGKARQIYEMLDKRLPKSTTPEKPIADGAGPTAAKRGTAEQSPPDISGLIGALGGIFGQQSQAPSTSTGSPGKADGACTPSDAVAYTPFAAPSASIIPLVAGLTITTAKSDAAGDYEPLLTVRSVTPEAYTMSYSAEYPDALRGGTRELTVVRKIPLADHRAARCTRAAFREGDAEVFPGTTVFFSSAVLNDLRANGKAAITMVQVNSLFGLANFEQNYTGTLSRVEPQSVLLPVLVNGREAELPAIHARARLADGDKVERHDMFILDEPENPIVLRSRRGTGSGYSFRVVKIDFPVPDDAATSIERSLAEDRKAVVYGIYFAFASAKIRPESERVLQEIADAMQANPGWALRIDGHTDSIGSDDANLKLSRERAEAVMAALVKRYGIAADRFTSGGYGERSPKDTNDTPEGRARNRRVELVRL